MNKTFLKNDQLNDKMRIICTKRVFKIPSKGRNGEGSSKDQVGEEDRGQKFNLSGS